VKRVIDAADIEELLAMGAPPSEYESANPIQSSQFKPELIRTHPGPLLKLVGHNA
jgi:hypothetical protein